MEGTTFLPPALDNTQNIVRCSEKFSTEHTHLYIRVAVNIYVSLTWAEMGSCGKEKEVHRIEMKS